MHLLQRSERKPRLGTGSRLWRLRRSEASREDDCGPQASFLRGGADLKNVIRALGELFTVLGVSPEFAGSDAGLSKVEAHDVGEGDPAHVLGVPGGFQIGWGLKLFGLKRPLFTILLYRATGDEGRDIKWDALPRSARLFTSRQPRHFHTASVVQAL